MKAPWFLDEKAVLKGLWSDGLTVKQIKDRMKDRTECAIIGQAHRMGLSRRDNPVKLRKPPKPKVLIKCHCRNPDCGIEITGIGGHKDRYYCTQGCANKVYRDRDALEREMKPLVARAKLTQCAHRDDKERRCTYLALPGSAECYGDLHA